VSEREESQAREHRAFVNLAAAIVILVLAISMIWILGLLDEKRKAEACIDAGRRDCLERFYPEAALSR
jgi:hypothetical protein